MKKFMILFAILTALIPSVNVFAQTRSSNKDDKKVLVAYAIDITQESECLYDNDIPCPDGSVIGGDIITYEEAIEKGYTDYVLITGDEKKDDEARFKLHKKVHDDKKPKTKKSESYNINWDCSLLAKEVTGSFIPQQGQPRVIYNSKFFRDLYCNLSSMQDQARLNDMTSATIKWIQSCLADSTKFNCVLRDSPSFGKTLTINWTNYYNINLTGYKAPSEYSMYTKVGTFMTYGTYPGFGN